MYVSYLLIYATAAFSFQRLYSFHLSLVPIVNFAPMVPPGDLVEAIIGKENWRKLPIRPP